VSIKILDITWVQTEFGFYFLPASLLFAKNVLPSTVMQLLCQHCYFLPSLCAKDSDEFDAPDLRLPHRCIKFVLPTSFIHFFFIEALHQRFKWWWFQPRGINSDVNLSRKRAGSKTGLSALLSWPGMEVSFCHLFFSFPLELCPGACFFHPGTARASSRTVMCHTCIL